MSTILIIDDDEKLTGLVSDYLAKFGYEALRAHDPLAGLKLTKTAGPDLIILDIMLPDMDGFEVCRRIRRESDVPVLMLTARGEVTDRIVGLELGADDYLPKPFEPRELLARIQTILRRSGKGGSRKSVLEFEGLRIDRDRMEVYLTDGEQVANLTSLEFSLLELLARKPGKVYTRDEIISHLQGVDAEIFSRAVDIAVSRIRQKLGDTQQPHRFIKTVRGNGYVFAGKEL